MKLWFSNTVGSQNYQQQQKPDFPTAEHSHPVGHSLLPVFITEYQ